MSKQIFKSHFQGIQVSINSPEACIEENIAQARLSKGLILLINPPADRDTGVEYRLVNKITNLSGKALYPALYGNFSCPEAALRSDELYRLYEEAKKSYAYENIFVFEIVGHRSDAISISELVTYTEKLIAFQSELVGMGLNEDFESFLASDFYKIFLTKYSFTVSEQNILKGLLRYAFLLKIGLHDLISDIENKLNTEQTIKLARKEILNVLRSKLS